MKGKGNCYSLQAVLPCKAICLQTQNEREPKAELDDKALEIVLATMFGWEPQMFHIMRIGTKNPVQIYMCCDPEPFMWKCSPLFCCQKKIRTVSVFPFSYLFPYFIALNMGRTTVSLWPWGRERETGLPRWDFQPA